MAALENDEVKIATPKFNPNNLTTVVAAVVSFGTLCISGAQLGVNFFVTRKESEVAQLSKDKEIEVAKEQKERELANAWQRDFYAYMKENYQVIFDPSSADGSAKRRMVLATFPPDIVAQLRNSLSPSSAEEAALLEMPSASPSPASSATPLAAPALPPPRLAINSDEPTVYMQYLQSADAELANQVLAALSNGKFRTPGKQLVNAFTGDKAEVRYYRAEEKSTAEQIGKVVQSVLNEPPTVRSLEGRYKNLPRNTFEVWLPRTAASAEGAKVKAPAKSAERPLKGQETGPR